MSSRLAQTGAKSLSKGVWAAAAALLILLPGTAIAQDKPREQDDGREVIDILVEVPGAATDQRRIEECERAAEAGVIANEIVVCREILQDNSHYYSGSREAAQDRYAEETMNEGLAPAPDVAGAGIFRGPPTVSGLCFIPPCPAPPVLIIDVEALPEAPAGSDADRIARGLPPIGSEDGADDRDARRRVLGLPAPPSPAGSVERAEEP